MQLPDFLLDKYPTGVYNIIRINIRRVIIMGETCENCKKKHRDEAEYKALINRLNRIEGQVGGIRRMIERDAYCIDILTQVSAVNAALGAFRREILETHIKSCVAEGIKSGDDSVVQELIATLSKIVR